MIQKGATTATNSERFGAGGLQWKITTVGVPERAGKEAIANATEENPEELLEVATAVGRRSIISKEQAVEQMERDLQRMSRERLLPGEKTLEKVAR